MILDAHITYPYIPNNFPVKMAVLKSQPFSFSPNLHEVAKTVQCQARFGGRQHLRHLTAG